LQKAYNVKDKKVFVCAQSIPRTYSTAREEGDGGGGT